MIEVSNTDATPTKLAYYRDLPAGGKTYAHVVVLPGLNLIPKSKADLVGIGGPRFHYAHIEITQAAKLPVSAALELAERSVAMDALTCWLMTERRPAVREKIAEKIEQRNAATGGVGRPQEDDDSGFEGLIGSEEMPDGLTV